VLARAPVHTTAEVAIQSENDIVTARKVVRAMSTDLAFGLTDVTRIVTAASELARNIYVHAGSGVMRCQKLEQSHRIGLELTFEDHGPGIADLDMAMTDGYTTNAGLGMGLPGSRRLMDEFTIDSNVGQGTTVRIRKWRR
jgi:serine/threonine-protein kinase RsbT